MRAQKIAAFALLPFFALLIVHGLVNDVPLFLASFAGFAAALPGIFTLPRTRGLALHEAHLEYAEYYFLFPLFLSITLLTSAGFFDVMQTLVVRGIDVLGPLARRVRAVPRQHGAVGDSRQQHRRRLRVARPARARASTC